MPLFRTRKWLAQEIARIEQKIRQERGNERAAGGAVISIRKDRLEKRLAALKKEFLEKNPRRTSMFRLRKWAGFGPAKRRNMRRK